MKDFEQIEIESWDDLQRDIKVLTSDAIRDAATMIERFPDSRINARNRHEAYGIVAQRIPAMIDGVKTIRKGADDLLSTLSRPMVPAVEALSALINRVSDTAAVMIEASAAYQIALRDLFQAEESLIDRPEDEDQEGFLDAEPVEEGNQVPPSEYIEEEADDSEAVVEIDDPDDN